VVIDRGHVTRKRCNAVVNGFPAPLERFRDGLRDLRVSGSRKDFPYDQGIQAARRRPALSNGGLRGFLVTYFT
jgi:hypothetical protein